MKLQTTRSGASGIGSEMLVFFRSPFNNEFSLRDVASITVTEIYEGKNSTPLSASFR